MRRGNHLIESQFHKVGLIICIAALILPAVSTPATAFAVDEVTTTIPRARFNAPLFVADRGDYANIELFVLNSLDTPTEGFRWSWEDRDRNIVHLVRTVHMFRAVRENGETYGDLETEIRRDTTGGIAARVPTADIKTVEFKIELDDGSIIETKDVVIRASSLGRVADPTKLSAGDAIGTLASYDWRSGYLVASGSADGALASYSASPTGDTDTFSAADSGSASSAFAQVRGNGGVTPSINTNAIFQLQIFDNLRQSTAHYSTGAAWARMYFIVDEFGGSGRTLTYLLYACDSSPMDPGDCSNTNSGFMTWTTGAVPVYNGAYYQPRFREEGTATGFCEGSYWYCTFFPPSANHDSEQFHVVYMRMTV